MNRALGAMGIAALAAWCLAMPQVLAEHQDVTVYKKNGSSFQATIISQDDEHVTFDVVYDTITVPKSEIDRMVPLAQAAAPPAPPGRKPASANTGLQLGNRPPDFTAKDLDGRAQTLTAYRGRVVGLHFWATWCPHCRNSIPFLVQLYRAYALNDVLLLSVSTDDREETVRAFVRQQGLPYPVIHSRSLAGQYHIEGIPMTFVIDREGIIRYRQAGESDGFVDAVARALGAS